MHVCIESEALVEAQVEGFRLYRQGAGVDRIAGAEAIISECMYMSVCVYIVQFIHNAHAYGCVK